MKLRGFTRHTYTIARRQYIDVEGYPSNQKNDDYMYIRGTGLVMPSSAIASVSDANEIFLTHEIQVVTKEDFPTIDNVDATDGINYGDEYHPDVVMWTSQPYPVYGQNMWVQMGKSNYRKVLCNKAELDGVGASGWKGTLRELNWDEIDAFSAAVNGSEAVNELMLAKVEI